MGDFNPRYSPFILLGIISALIGIFALPSLFRLEGPMEVYAIFGVGFVLTPLALYYYSRSISVVLKGIGFYTIAFLICYASIYAFITFPVTLPFTFFAFPLMLAILVLLPKFKKSENFAVAGTVSLVILTSFLVFTLFFAYSAYEHYNARYIYVKRLEVPEYVEMSASDFPFIQDLDGSRRIDLSPTEMVEFGRFTSKHIKLGDSFFYAKVGGDYYKVKPITLIGVSFSEGNCSKAELDCCPTLVKLMNQAKEVARQAKEDLESKFLWRVSVEELAKVKRLVGETGDKIEYEGDCYHVFFDCSIWMEKVVTPRCEEVSDAELEAFPLLKKALVEANEEGSADLKVSPEEWNEIRKFVNEKGCLRYNGSSFMVNFMLV